MVIQARQRPAKRFELRMRKGADFYLFKFDTETIRCMIDRMEVYASDERLSFDWDDFYIFRNAVLCMEATQC